MKMVLQLLVSHRRLNRQWVLSKGECVASVLVKLTRKLGWKVGYAENLYVELHADFNNVLIFNLAAAPGFFSDKKCDFRDLFM